MTLSVVIPVLNERDSLPAAIAALRASHGIAEIIVADGGSSDGTLPWLQAQPDLILVNAARGKGPQLNAGAARATGDILLFLHADCVVTQPAIDALLSALSDARVSGPKPSAPKPSAAKFSGPQLSGPQLSVRRPLETKLAGGAFYLRFAEPRPRSLRLVAAGINLRAWLRHSATGDQGIFVRREVFRSIGGAPDWPLFEDVELVRRIKQTGKFAILKTPVTVSGRRYIRHGVLRTALLIYALRLAYWLGVPPQRLKEWFRDARHSTKGKSGC